MDALAALLQGPRARSAFLLRSSFDPPWGLRIEDRAPLTVVAVGRGSVWIVPDGDEPEEISAGDIAIVKGPTPYVVADRPDRSPRIVIHPGNACTTLQGEPLDDQMGLGVRTWGNTPDGQTIMLTGTYEHAGEASARLLEVLPTIALVRADGDPPALIDLFSREIVRDAVGQQVVLDRMLDVVLIDALRRWFAADPDRAPGWLRAYDDAVVGKALRMMHAEPSKEWSVERLAAAVGLSRAALARRFNAAVGEPPMTYLAKWRMALAADLLEVPGASVGGVAREVGFRSPFTFSAAFKRIYGVSPSEHRSLAAS